MRSYIYNTTLVLGQTRGLIQIFTLL